jgi:hypothetical protein
MVPLPTLQAPQPSPVTWEPIPMRFIPATPKRVEKVTTTLQAEYRVFRQNQDQFPLVTGPVTPFFEIYFGRHHNVDHHDGAVVIFPVVTNTCYITTKLRTLTLNYLSNILVSKVLR